MRPQSTYLGQHTSPTCVNEPLHHGLFQWLPAHGAERYLKYRSTDLKSMNIVLFDTPQARVALEPFSLTRPLAKMRIGILTIEEKWQQYIPGTYSYLTADYLQKKFPFVKNDANLFINATVCPSPALVAAIKGLQPNENLLKDNKLIACYFDAKLTNSAPTQTFDHPRFKRVPFRGPITQLCKKWDLFLLNDQELRHDFQCLSAHKPSQGIQDLPTIAYNKEDIFLEDDVHIRAAILNAESGPIHIGQGATIQEGAVIKGPASIGAHAHINANAIIRNATTIGPYARVGGEVSNSIIMGFSNKAHQGFMGNSVVGQWCNLGAGTSTSNLRNDYREVKVWDYGQEDFGNTNLQFCGLFMGDHSKCSINTMFNTGTVVGVNANLFGAGLIDKFVPSFTWGGPDMHIQTYRLDRALEVAKRMMRRRAVELKAEDKAILTHIFRITAIHRVKDLD